MNTPIRVLMTSASYPANAKDWKALFIRHMLYSLAERSDVKIQFWGPPGERPIAVHYACTNGDEQFLSKLMHNGGVAHLIRSKTMRGVLAPLSLLWRLRNVYRIEPIPDIYHVNWLQCALPLPCENTPLLVTVLGTDFALLKHKVVVSLLKRIFRSRKCLIAPNAEWMVPRLEQLFGEVAKVRHIPFGVDARWFKLERIYSSSKPKKWLLVSRLTKRKIGPLFDWGQTIFQGDNELHIFGPMQEDLTLPTWVHYHGSTHPSDLEENWFPDAAGLISLSEHDEGCPQVMLEAMASGLPIIASHLEAHTGIISHRKTGWIVNTKNDLAEAVSWITESKNNQSCSELSRKHMSTLVGTWSDCAGRYADAYRYLLNMKNDL